MEESTDNAPQVVVVDLLDTFKKEIEAMHKQINDRKPIATFDDLLRRAKKYITMEEVRKANKAESKPSTSEKKKPLSWTPEEFIYHDRQNPRGQKRKDPEKKQDDKGKLLSFTSRIESKLPRREE
ncbi:hypothetical protein ACS0TY_005746 [Phlomoides rotata]